MTTDEARVGARVTCEWTDPNSSGTVVEPTPEELKYAPNYDHRPDPALDALVAWDDGFREWAPLDDLRLLPDEAQP